MGAEYNDATGDAGSPDALRRRLRGRPLLLDGATGTELERRGLHTGLPLWSTHALLEAPDAVEAIHRSYVAAGAEAVTANTFRTQRRTLARAGLGERAGALTALAVERARRAGPAFVLGSAPPLEDCYRPDLAPDDASLAREHAEHADHLARAGVDGILVETHGSLRETRAACRAAAATGLPFCASFVSWQAGRILSGESLVEALELAAESGASAVGVNCLPPSCVPACTEALSRSGLPFAVYANLGEPEDETGFRRSEDCPPEAFARHARAWLAAGAEWIGGCCGTTPDHIRAVAEELAAASDAQEPGDG